MSTEDGGSVTRWLGDIKGGDLAAAQPLWERYFAALMRLAYGKLRSTPKAVADEEDVALSAFQSFCDGVARGRFPKLGDRSDLWPLLVVLTKRKALDQIQRQGRQKRGGGRNVDVDLREIEEIVGREPTPEFATMVVEEYQRLLDRLGDGDLRQLALWRMEGCRNEVIAERLGCALASVGRKLRRVREILSEPEPPTVAGA